MLGLVGFVPGALLVFVAGNVADRYERKRILQACQFARRRRHCCWHGAPMPAGSRWSISSSPSAFSGPRRRSKTRRLPRCCRWSCRRERCSAPPPCRAVRPNWRPSQGRRSAASPMRSRPLCRTGVMVAFWSTAAICAGAVRLVLPPAPKTAATPGDLFAGFHFIRNNPAILGTLSLDLFAVLFGGAVALLPIYARDILQTGPWGLGVLRAAPAVGALLTTVVLARQPIKRRVGMRMFQAVIIFGIGDGGVRGVALDVAVAAVAGGSRRGRHRERGDPSLAGATRHARCDARPRRRGELPVHQRLEPARPVRKRRHRRAAGHGAGGRVRRRRRRSRSRCCG